MAWIRLVLIAMKENLPLRFRESRLLRHPKCRADKEEDGTERQDGTQKSPAAGLFNRAQNLEFLARFRTLGKKRRKAGISRLGASRAALRTTYQRARASDEGVKTVAPQNRFLKPCF
jgi:hypothetical protein